MHLHTLLHVLNEAAPGLKLTVSIEFSLFSFQTDISLNKVAPTVLLNYLAGKYVIFLEKIWSLPINGKCRWLVNVSDWVKTAGAIVCLGGVVGTQHFKVLELRRDLHFKYSTNQTCSARSYCYIGAANTSHTSKKDKMGIFKDRRLWKWNLMSRKFQLLQILMFLWENT